jgi:NAD(P)-dependent dehydrogenase (short-subunit alcohol dehydrogenase family)
MKKIFITGASAGIGAETVQLLLAEGHQVWGTSRSLTRLPPRENFHPVAMDLTDSASIESAYRQAEADAGWFDVVINNAGAGLYSPLELITPEHWRGQFETLVHGPVRLMQLALPKMRDRRSGRIINVTSLAARFPIPFMLAYSAGKAAMASASAGLRMELTGSPIRIIDVQPGDISTQFHETTPRHPDAAPEYEPFWSKAWAVIDKNMAVAPSPAIVARKIARLVTHPRPPVVVTAGDFFQTKVATLAQRLFPISWVEWGTGLFYRI